MVCLPSLRIGEYPLVFLDTTYDIWFFSPKEKERRVHDYETIGGSQDDFIGYKSTASEIRQRMFLAGYDEKSLEHDFNNTKQQWLDDIRESIGYYSYSYGKFKENISQTVDLISEAESYWKLIESSTFDDYKAVFYELIMFDGNKKRERTKNINPKLLEFIKEGIQEFVSDESAGFSVFEFPCSQQESMALLLLDLCEDDDLCTIDITQLVRDGWVDDDDNEVLKSTKFYQNFTSSLNELHALNKEQENPVLQRMLFSSVITTMEAYLSDTMKRNVLNRDAIKRRFVKNSESLKRAKNICLNDIFDELEKLDKKIINEIESISYHNVEVVTGLYKNVLLCKFPEAKLAQLSKCVEIRHDIVHRNGITTNGSLISITIEDVQDLIELAIYIIGYIDKQILDKLLDTESEQN
ncbi:HEPN/Toprim-associated domain-containing protein [Aeromonas hydrophila]|uniref:HEPN/Toprim-associated domain-containing protein n=1 Tax=Aeromonas hydrophila TaxID=644 RepID=UPI0036DE5242